MSITPRKLVLLSNTLPLDCRVDRNIRDKYDTILLHSASYHGELETAQILLKNGVKPNVKNHLGETALHVVSRGRHDIQGGVNIAQLLLERDVDVNAQRKDQRTPLHIASYLGKIDIARVLLDRGANANAKDDRGESPLHQLSRGEHNSQDGVQVAQLLLGRGVDVNAQCKNHLTPLHVASYFGKPWIAQVLLDYGAKANAKNDRGETPLHQVSQGEYKSQADGVGVAQLLLDRGVDVNVQDKSRATPLHLASWNGRLEIAQVLLKHTTQISSNDKRALSHISLKGAVNIPLRT